MNGSTWAEERDNVLNMIADLMAAGTNQTNTIDTIRDRVQTVEDLISDQMCRLERSVGRVEALQTSREDHASAHNERMNEMMARIERLVLKG